jgi:phosphatidylglycerophosphate synthase
VNEAAAADISDDRGGVSSSPIEATYKAREVEGALDLLFYRRVGFRLAQFFAARSTSPAQVTFVGTAVGVAAGHLYMYEALALNALGMLLHVSANLLDNVDGQLARLTHRQSEQGRVIDGIGDNVVFASVYAHLCIRHVNAGGSQLVWLVALAAAICHSFQSAAAEFCRDVYARFASGRKTQLYHSNELRRRQQNCRWTDAPLQKLLLALHANYVAQQETALPRLAQLRDWILRNGAPNWFTPAYEGANGALVRHARLLGTNARMLVLFVALLLRRPVWYFIAELTVFNALFVWLLIRQNSLGSQLLRRCNERAAS